MLILISMVIPTMGFIAAGSVDPRMHRTRHCEIIAGSSPPEERCGEPNAIVADHGYPKSAVLMSCSLVLAEGLILSLILTGFRFSIGWRALLAGVAAGIPAAEMRSATLGLPPWYGYVTYHFLWLAEAPQTAARPEARTVRAPAATALAAAPRPATQPLEVLVAGTRPA